MANDPPIDVEVAYASYDEQTVISLKVSPGTTARAAVEKSGILRRHPEIDLTRNKLGVFGRRVEGGYQLRMDDRVEIYRPLRVDPKLSRKRRARRS
jgi:putative ubiquitin-RnfH superfamily antitoxin RatB of RatAB toxin-antitoxin module